MSASGEAPGDRPRPATPAAIATRRYGWAIGILALALVIGFTLYALSSHKSGVEGVAGGGQVRMFAAPLAASTLKGDANLNPPCTLARHDPRALNVCLLVKRAPLVLAFFVTNSSSCEHEVDTMQALAGRRGPLRRAQYAAVAVNGSQAATAKAVHAHRWTIPVAYDADGAVGGLYGVTACPLLELVDRGGTVAERLIGERWLSQRALATRVRALLESNGRRRLTAAPYLDGRRRLTAAPYLDGRRRLTAAPYLDGRRRLTAAPYLDGRRRLTAAP